VKAGKAYKTKANRDIWSVMKIVILVLLRWQFSTALDHRHPQRDHGAGEVTGKNFLKFFTSPIIWMCCPTRCLLRDNPRL
jgi:hypothetical protein